MKNKPTQKNTPLPGAFHVADSGAQYAVVNYAGSVLAVAPYKQYAEFMVYAANLATTGVVGFLSGLVDRYANAVKNDQPINGAEAVDFLTQVLIPEAIEILVKMDAKKPL